MFKSSGTTRAKSPYQPKLLHALIDSSDEENLSMSSGQHMDDDFDQQKHYQDNEQGRKSQHTSPFNNEDKRSIKSVYTSFSQQTVKVKQSTDLNQTKNVQLPNPPTPNQSISSKPQTLNLTRFAQSKQSKQMPTSSDQFASNSQKPKSSQSPNLPIKYDTLKLSEYDTKEIKKQEMLYQQNLNDFRQKFNSSKPSEKQNNNQLFSQNNQKEIVDDYMDSLQAMKKSNLNRRHLSRKSLKNEISTPSSRIKFLQEQRQQNSSEKQSQIDLFDSNLQIQRLRQELKRSKDVIKTLGLKNTDLQKSLEMKNTKLMEFESEEKSQLAQMKGQKSREDAEKKVYYQINCYMKERVKDFMDQIKTIKMSPLLEQSLEGFLAQILQLNQITISKMIGSYEIESQSRQHLNEMNRNSTPNRLSKSIFKTKSEIDQKQQPSKLHTSSNQFCNRQQKGYPQSHFTIGNKRYNAIISSSQGYQAQSSIKGISVKVNLSSNKENITPNKKIDTDGDLRQLQKSLQKLKAMEKQLSTPAPKNSFMTNHSHFISNNDQFRTEYSVINKSHLSGMGRDQNNTMNLSSNNLDRSKSRRKKIFAQANHK